MEKENAFEKTLLYLENILNIFLKHSIFLHVKLVLKSF